MSTAACVCVCKPAFKGGGVWLVGVSWKDTAACVMNDFSEAFCDERQD